MPTVKTGILWSALDQLSSQGVGLVISLFLARLLSPKDYGLISVCLIFVNFAGIFIECGFSNALIRKNDWTDADLNTAFYLNVLLGGCVYAFLLVTAPVIGHFYESQDLVAVIRIVSLTVVFNSLCVVQNAILTAALRIKEQAVVRLCAQVPMGLIAIWMAYRGCGVYALAVQTTGAAALSMIALWGVSGWRPRMKLSMDSMKYLWSFGSKLLCANTIGMFFNEVYSFLIGKSLGIFDLGIYTFARNLANKPNLLFIGIIQKVALPYVSRAQNDQDELLFAYRRCVRASIFTMCMVSGAALVLASPVIQILWGMKWVSAIVPFQVLIVSFLLSPVSTLHLVFLQVIKRSDLVLKVEFVKKPIAVLGILLAFRLGLVAIIVLQVVLSIVECFCNSVAVSRVTRYSFRLQVSDLARPIISSLFLVVPLLFLEALFSSSVLLQLGVAVLGGCLLFVIGASLNKHLLLRDILLIGG